MYEALQQLDPIRINFSASGMHIINFVLSFVMFGVALEIKLSHFKTLIKQPKSALVGLTSQVIVLPFTTFLLAIALSDYITPTVAMGMILVAACPDGNISNFITQLSKGNTELSVGLAATTTMLATITTPFNFALWGGLYINYTSKHADKILQPLVIDNMQMFQTVFILLGIPLILGMLFSKRFPITTLKIKKPIQNISIIFFLLLVVLAFANNWKLFVDHIFFIFILVLLQNSMALFTGYGMGTLFKVPPADRRAISIETGIQNSGLGLVLLFNPKIFPPELQLGGMIFITAWWGIWHIISGLSIAYFWSKRPLK